MLVRNPWQGEFANRVAFLTASRSPHGITADRTEFIGREGTLRRPAALERWGLTGNVQPGRDPCAAFQVHLDLPADAEDEVVFVLGEGRDREHALELVARWREPSAADAAWERLGRFWDDRLDTDPCRDSRWRDERHAEPMAPLSGHRLEDVRQNGLLSVEWRHRFSRSAAGRAGARHGRARAVPRASSGLRRPTIRRRRRAALVAPACRARGTDAMLG